MEVTVQVNLDKLASPYGGEAVKSTGDGNVSFKAPSELISAGFPANEATFTFPSVAEPGQGRQASQQYAQSIAENFLAKRQNAVVYSYGARLTEKRQVLFNNGLVAKVLAQVFAAAPPAGVSYMAMCYATGGPDAESLDDLIDASNKNGILVETVREGPRVTKIEKRAVKTAADAQNLAATIATNVETRFAATTQQVQSPEEQALPPYDPASVVFVLQRFDTAEDLDANVECNSLTFIALGDCERPVLCGIDAEQMMLYERAQKTLGSVYGVLSAIRSARLRIPFGKAKLTSLLKRAYNSEKNYPHAANNAPTQSYFLVHLLNDDGSSEEAYHTLAMTRRVLNVLTSASVGVPTRDLAADKWRLEQDIVELKDELAIARVVHGYKPCIFEQAKPVANIQEEEAKRIGKIKEQQEAQRKRAKEEVLEKARIEAEAIIKAEEAKCAMTLPQLEQAIQAKLEENRVLQAERQKKEEDHRKHLEKIRRKREEEESQAEQLRADVERLKADVEAKQAEIKEKQHQLSVASQDAAKGRETILKEREEKRQARQKLFEERRQQRAKWLEEIKAANDRLVNQVKVLSDLRKEKNQATGGENSATDIVDQETEEAVLEDVGTINRYLPDLIQLEDQPANIESTETIRRQLEEYFVQEKATYAERLEQEKQRLAVLEKAVDQYRAKVTDFQAQKRKELLADATKKEHHLQSLIDQVIQYLQHGVRMYKVSSNGQVRRRFFFLSDDCKRMFGCDLDDAGLPINRKKPTMTIVFRDLKRVILGTYTPSFVNFAGGEAKLRSSRLESMTEDGSYNKAITPMPTPQNLGKYNYRAFCLELKGGKTVELVCDSDSDCEAWLLALKRVLYYRTPTEKHVDDLHGRVVPETICDLMWGAALDVRPRPGFEKLSVDEATLCSNQHIPPKLFLNIKEFVIKMSQNAWVTIYDIRKHSTIDMLRAQALHEFFTDCKLIQPVGIGSH